MRRRNRHIRNGALLIGTVALGVNIFKQWLGKREKGEKLTLDNFDGSRALKTTLLWAGIGGFSGYVYYRYNVNEESKLPFSSDEYLKKILTKEHLKSDSKYLKAVLVHRNKLKEWLASRFDGLLKAFPQDGGSFAKRTAIASNYDLDIVLVFKSGSYATLEDMYYDVYDALRKAYGKNASVTKQTKAIGIAFEYKGVEICFDIVPGRETHGSAGDINLYVRPDWVWQRGSSFKTNVFSQRKLTVNKPEARQVVKLLKIYRDRNGFELPSIIIEQCVVSAMSERNFGIQSSITENLFNSMDMLARKLEQRGLQDISNSNNNLNEKLDYSTRSIISNQLIKGLRRAEKNPRYVKEMFDL